MTDENSRQEEHEEPEPHARIGDDGEIEFRDEDGNWHKHVRISTGDPELDSLWEMPVDEVERIAEDASHPLHDKAKQVQYDAAEPIREMIAAMARSWVVPINIDWGRRFSRLNFMPWTDWGPLVRELSGIWSPLVHPGLQLGAKQTRAGVSSAEDAPTSDFLEHGADSSDIDGFDIGEEFEPSLTDAGESVRIWHLYEMARLQLEETRKHTDHWVQSLDAAEKASKQSERSLYLATKANKLSESANKTAQSNTVISVLALAVSAAAAIAAVISVMQ